MLQNIGIGDQSFQARADPPASEDPKVLCWAAGCGAVTSQNGRHRARGVSVGPDTEGDEAGAAEQVTTVHPVMKTDPLSGPSFFPVLWSEIILTL